MKKLFIAIALAGGAIAAEAATSQLGSIKANAYVVTSEDDPTVAEWARTNHPPPIADLTPAYNYTDSATNALATNMLLNAAMTDSVIDLAAYVATNKAYYIWEYSPAPEEGWLVSGDPYYNSEENRWAQYFYEISAGIDNSVYFAYDSSTSTVLHLEYMYGKSVGVDNIIATRRRNPIPSLGLVATNDLASAIRDATNNLAPKAMISAADTNFYNAVAQVVDVKFDEAVTNALTNAVVATVYSIDGTNIVTSVVTNTVAVAMNDLLGDGWRTKYGGGLAGALAAILAALALLQKKKISTLKCGSITVGNGATAGETDVSLLFTSQNTSLFGLCRYNITPLTVTSGTATATDAAVNTITLSVNTTVNQPDSTGKVRDWIVYVVQSESNDYTIDFNGNFVKDFTEWPTIAVGERYVFSFTEVASNTFLAAYKKVS